MDLVVEDSVVVEVKAVAKLDRVHEAQLISYLKLSGLRLGLLLNFNVRNVSRRRNHEKGERFSGVRNGLSVLRGLCGSFRTSVRSGG